MKQKHFMLDLETWGTGPYSSIIAVGLVYFDPNGGGDDRETPEPSFYMTIDPVSNERAGFRTDASTISWWLDPKRRPAWDEWMKPQHFDVADAFNAMGIWFDEIDQADPPDPVNTDHLSSEEAQEAEVAHRIIWGNGPAFDNELMKQAHRLLKIPMPWNSKGQSDRCFRSFKNLPRAGGVRPADTGIQHSALADALYQARWLQNILREYQITC